MSYKKPVSVLVVIHTPALDVLLLERARHPGFWQSVTGSQEGDEPLLETARREVREETGIEAGKRRVHRLAAHQPLRDFRRMALPLCARRHAQHRARLQPVPARTRPVHHRPDEHLAYRWLPWKEAAGLLLLEQSRRDPGLAATHRTDRLAATDSDGILSAPWVS
jgi:dATP pyrophosphohydrolase